MKIGKLHIGNSTLVLHSLFWIGWVISFTLIQTIGEGFSSWNLWLMYYLLTLPIFITHTYLIAYWLLPVTFFKGRYLYFAIGICAFLLFFSILELTVSNHLVFAVFDKTKIFQPGYLNLKNIVISGVGNHYIILVFLAIKAGAAWYRTDFRKEELMRTKLETELEIYRYQLQPKMVLSLMEELEIVAEKEPAHTPEMIIQISNFLNDFLPTGKEELIPLKSEIKLLEDFLTIHKQALNAQLSSNFIVNGNLNPYVIPPLLLLPFINSAIKIAYKCNESFESNVIIKAERNYLLLSFTFWSEQPFKINDKSNSRITQERLNYTFPGKYRLLENVDDNFKEISIEIFAKV